MIGPGKYDAVCTAARVSANAAGVVLIVLGGKHGDGFSVQAPIEVLAGLPKLLRILADSIESDASFS